MTNESQERSNFIGWLMWGLACCFYCYRYLLEVSPAVMVTDLMRTFSVSGAALGNLAAFYLYAYASMQVPVGILLDRFGARRLLTIAALVCGIGGLLFASANGLVSASFGRLLCGAGSAFTVVGCLYIAANWLPANRFALATGFNLTFGMAGAIFGSAPLALLVAAVDWRNTLYILAAIGFMVALSMWLFIKDKKDAVSSTEPSTFKSVLTGLRTIVQNKQSWLLGIYGGLLFMPISIFGSLWGIPFLIHKYGCTNAHAASLISSLFFGIAIGSPVFGWISDRTGRRKIVMYISSIGTVIAASTLLYWPELSQFIAGICLFSLGFFTGASFVAYAAILENNSQKYAGSAIGFMNMMNMIGGALGQPLVGLFLDWQWNGALVNGVREYSLANYQWSLMLLPSVMFTSLVLLPFIRETYCKRA